LAGGVAGGIEALFIHSAGGTTRQKVNFEN
jgi:hypothetical protein